MISKKDLLDKIEDLQRQSYNKVSDEVLAATRSSMYELLRGLETRIRRLEENAAPKCDSCGHIITEKPSV